METKLIQPGNERSVKDTYTLDGKEYDFTPPVPPNRGFPAPKGKRRRPGCPATKASSNRCQAAETPKGTGDDADREEVDHFAALASW